MAPSDRKRNDAPDPRTASGGPASNAAPLPDDDLAALMAEPMPETRPPPPPPEWPKELLLRQREAAAQGNRPDGGADPSPTPARPLPPRASALAALRQRDEEAQKARRVLVCMARKDELDRVVNALDEAGFHPEIRGASDMGDAFADASAPRPLALILDGDVPALRDFAPLKRLRDHPDFARTLVVYCHHRVDIGYVLRAMDEGAGVFLFTPVDPARLLRHLNARIA